MKKKHKKKLFSKISAVMIFLHPCLTKSFVLLRKKQLPLDPPKNISKTITATEKKYLSKKKK